MNSVEIINNKAKFYTMELWSKELSIPITINKRLKSTLGWYVHNEKIELSPQILNNEFILDDVLLHELCHWHCHITGKEFKDYSKDFENELERIGSSSSFFGDYSSMKVDNKITLGFKYKYIGYKCNVCESTFKTTNYLEDKVEGKIGRQYKKFYCCDKEMELSTSEYIVEDFKPDTKLVDLNKKFWMSH